jgi:hypothetical protein
LSFVSSPQWIAQVLASFIEKLLQTEKDAENPILTLGPSDLQSMFEKIHYLRGQLTKNQISQIFQILDDFQIIYPLNKVDNQYLIPILLDYRSAHPPSIEGYKYYCGLRFQFHFLPKGMWPKLVIQTLHTNPGFELIQGTKREIVLKTSSQSILIVESNENDSYISRNSEI